MASTIIEELADFALKSDYSTLPADVIDESKRLLLDSIGCALAATDEPKGRIGIEYGRLIGGPNGDATIIGTEDRVSIFGASFANGELINALDFDSVLPPGHVSPYVLPGALAVGETTGASGEELITAVAVSHEMSYRMGKAMDYVRDVKDGKVSPPPVFGYSSTVFGATAAIACLKGYREDVLASALGIAGAISPVNAHRAWTMHNPSSTIKYLMAGGLAQTALTAAHMAELGHRGDLQLLDDPEYGYRRFIGTGRWEPDAITSQLGTEWGFPPFVSYKPYPHCRVMHALFDGLIEIVEAHDLKPEEIEAINAWGEGWVEQPIWLSREVEHVHDAQFSMAHGLAVAAHRIPAGKEWQNPDVVFSRSVLDLMDRTTTAVHPDYASRVASDTASRPSRVEVVARGSSFVAERSYPKGSPSSDPTTLMTTDELVAKFRHNADGVLTAEDVDGVVDAILSLEEVDDVSTVMTRLGRSVLARKAEHVHTIT
jgi:2-methylcitrate dehydratase PrpD